MTGILGSGYYFNWGDLLTLGCALCAAIHIFWVGRVRGLIDSSFRFNAMQSLWAAAISIPPAIYLEGFKLKTITSHAIAGMFSLTVLSTTIAFFLAVRAQRVLSPMTASILYLLESPFAALFAFFILGDRLSLPQWLGAMIIVIAALFSIKAEAMFKKK